jgi:hypothetical protein
VNQVHGQFCRYGNGFVRTFSCATAARRKRDSYDWVQAAVSAELGPFEQLANASPRPNVAARATPAFFIRVNRDLCPLSSKCRTAPLSRQCTGHPLYSSEVGRSDYLSDEDTDLIGQCPTAAADGPFSTDWEFRSLMGLERSEVAELSRVALSV